MVRTDSNALPGRHHLRLLQVEVLNVRCRQSQHRRDVVGLQETVVPRAPAKRSRCRR
jgi:hypothetical protein